MVQGRQFAFLGNFQKCRAGINHPARAFGVLGGNCHVMALVITPLGILGSQNEHVSVSGLDFRSRVITGGLLLSGSSLTVRKVE